MMHTTPVAVDMKTLSAAYATYRGNDFDASSDLNAYAANKAASTA
jgi:hypothetical protein